jgi:hypothetical protein
MMRDERLRPENDKRDIHHFLTLIALLSFILLATHQLTLPGLHYDEAKEAGLNAMQLVTGQPVTAFREATVGVGPWRLPLMVQDYIGSLNVLFALPFLAVGGLSVSALRWLPVCIGALTLVVTGRVAHRLGGPVAAVVALFLLAVNPTFIFWSRQGIFVTNLTVLVFVLSLWTGLRWWQMRRPADLWWTALLWGVGLYAKLLFVWAIGALLAVAIIAWSAQRQIANRKSANQQIGESANQQIGESANPRIRESANQQIGESARPSADGRRFPFITHHSSLRIFVVAAGCFLLPLLPLILFNLETGGTVTSIFGNLGQSYYGVNNRAYLPNLLVRLGQLRTLLRGDHLWYLGEVYANQWAPWLAAGIAVLGGLLWAFPRHPVTVSLCHPVTPSPRHPVTLLPFGLLALIVAQSAFTVSDLFVTHYALLVPLIPLGVGLIAAGVLSTVRDLHGGRAGRLAGAVVCGLYCAAICAWGAIDLANTLRYHRVLSIAGGYATHSDAIYRLADFLRQRAPAAPLALDWGVDAPVRYLTAGRVNPVEVFGYERLDGPDPGFAGRLAPFLDNPDNLYVAHTGEFTIFRGRAEALEQLAAARSFRLEEAARFGERSGRPLFLVYRVVRP